MATLRDIRKRIRSVKNTQQITKAMKMVAASKLRRSQEAVLAARPYGLRLRRMLQALALRTDSQLHPFFGNGGVKRAELIVVSSDRGLCGGFNTSIMRAAEEFFRVNRDKYESITVSTIGRKGTEYFNRQKREQRHTWAGTLDKFNYGKAAAVAEKITGEILQSEYDAVFVLYNEFKSVMVQRVTVEQLLPIPKEELATEAAALDYIYEPSREIVLKELMAKYLGSQIYRQLLESLAAEFAARMTAMDSASKNAGEVIGALTLKYNRARQAAITKELVEIVSGAEAL